MTRPTENSASTSLKFRGLYFCLGFALALIQLAFTLRSMHSIRFEELFEAVRNVYWLDRGIIYDGVSSNVGYYGTLLFVYELFGFSIFTAKFVRFALHVTSLLCLAQLLLETLGGKRAWLPLITFGLSPTWLYFNTIQTSYGIDLAYFPICLLLIFRQDFSAAPSLILSFLLGLVTMIACMSYPTFLLYLPAIGLLFIARLSANRSETGHSLPTSRLVLHVIVGGSAFLLPLIGALIYLKDPGMLLYDSRVQAGIFRGGGKLGFDLEAMAATMLTTLGDLIAYGDSYYFELRRAEFSEEAFLALVVLLPGGIIAWHREKKFGLVFAAAYLLIGLGWFAPAFSAGNAPGLRRSTPVLAGIYMLLALCWHWALTSPFSKRWWRIATILICLLPLIHHVRILPDNFGGIGQASRWTNAYWFGTTHPQIALEVRERENAAGRPLACPRPNGPESRHCRYAEIFAAIAGYRHWNDLPPVPIRAFDWKSRKAIELNTRLWETYYFPH